MRSIHPRNLLWILMLVTITPAKARPVSYPGGWTVIQENDWESSRALIHYSPSATHSFGITGENFNQSDRYQVGGQWNHLLIRKNTSNSQFNCYVKSQVGAAFQGHLKKPYAAMGMSTDWETRRYFVSYAATFKHADKIDNGSFSQKGRLGIAPYVASYDSLHLWFMIQLDHNPEAVKNRHRLFITPLFRLFKGNYLVEIGLNTNGDVLANCIIRF